MALALGQGRIPRSREFWEWKHRRNPFGPSPILLAEEGDELLGLRVFLRWQWMHEGRVMEAVRAVDTATHPQWRGRGIFSELTRELADRMRDEGVAFVFNTPNRFSRPGYLKMGWHSLGKMNLWVRPVGLGRAVRSIAVSAAGSGRGKTATGDSPGSEVARLFADPAARDWLAAREPDGTVLQTARTLAYLQWRYAEIPGFRYRAAWKLDGDDGAVLIFCERARGRATELRICEILTGSGAGAAAQGGALLRAVCAESAPGVATAMPGPGPLGRRALLRAGFLPVPRSGPILTVRPLGDSVPSVDLLDRGSWRPSIGDLELF